MSAMLRQVTPIGAPASAARANGIINALIEQLPEPGASFGIEAREAWLEMMATAFTLVYGPAAARPSLNPRKGMQRDTKPAKAAKARPAAKRGASERAPVAKAEPPTAGFYIDLQGYARNEAGAQILPDDVTDVLYDHRGEFGDLSAIIWSDGTRGIPRGMQIEVSGAGAPSK